MGGVVSCQAEASSCPIPAEKRTKLSGCPIPEEKRAEWGNKQPTEAEIRAALTENTPKPAEVVNPSTGESACPVAPVKGTKAGVAVVDVAPNPATPSLPNETVVSSIPKAGSEGEYWVYPSPQRWYNAVKRKEQDPKWGFNPEEAEEVTEEAVPWAVYIHNTLNEQAWKEIMAYEELHTNECGEPKLESFRGRATEPSPKARILSFLRLAPTPFDRHDWVVDRCGSKQRYIIDYYAEDTEHGMPNIYIDVRPALTLGGAIDRVRMYLKTRSQERNTVHVPVASEEAK